MRRKLSILCLIVGVSSLVYQRGCDVPVIGVTDGPKLIAVVMPTEDSNPSADMLVLELRAGDPAKYLKEKAHTLVVLDDEQKGADKNPDPLVEALRPLFETTGLPATFVMDPETWKVYGQFKLPATGPEWLDALKKSGG